MTVPGYDRDVIELPGAGQEIGRGLAQLGTGLAGIINPYYEFHEKLREAMAANPELATRFADFALQSPEAFQRISRLLPKDVRAAVGSTQPSYQATKEAAKRPALQRIAEVPESKLPKDMTPAEAGAYKDIAQREAGQPNVKDLQDALSFQSSMSEQERGFVTSLGPERGLSFLAQMALSARLRKAAKEEEIDQFAEHQRQQLGHNLFQLYGFGTPDEWIKLATDPKSQQRARDLVAGKIPAVSQKDQQIMQMWHALSIPLAQKEQRVAQAELAQKAVIVRTMKNLRDEIEGTSTRAPAEEGRGKALVSAFQQQLDFLFGPGRFKAEYERKKMLGIIPTARRQIKVTDAGGNEVPPDFLETMSVDVSSTDPRVVNAKLAMNPIAQQVWSRIVASGDVQGGLHALYEHEIIGQKKPVANSIWLEIMRATGTDTATAR